MSSLLNRPIFVGSMLGNKSSALAIFVLLTASMGSLVAAPLAIPPEYSWVAQTTSESAAQGLSGAWLARLGFLLFGVSVLWLSASLLSTWALAARWMHTGFGLFMTATAAFSHHPWIAGASFDPFEDWLHSFTATGMGFAFAFGAFIRFVQRDEQDKRARGLDLLAVSASVFIPLLMVGMPTIGGLLQRLMFLIAYIWYLREVLVLYHADA